MHSPAGRKPLTLTREELEQLEDWAQEFRAPRARALRARIILNHHRGCSNRDSARRLRVTPQTVGKWLARFAACRIAGLADQPRAGAPRSISDTLVQAVLMKTLHEPPPQGTRWSSRRLAAVLGVSQRTVLRIWHAFDVSARASDSRGTRLT